MSDYTKVTIKKEVYELAKAKAAASNRSAANYIENLITKDLKTKGKEQIVSAQQGYDESRNPVFYIFTTDRVVELAPKDMSGGKWDNGRTVLTLKDIKTAKRTFKNVLVRGNDGKQ